MSPILYATFLTLYEQLLQLPYQPSKNCALKRIAIIYKTWSSVYPISLGIVCISLAKPWNLHTQTQEKYCHEKEYVPEDTKSTTHLYLTHLHDYDAHYLLILPRFLLQNQRRKTQIWTHIWTQRTDDVMSLKTSAQRYIGHTF